MRQAIIEGMQVFIGYIVIYFTLVLLEWLYKRKK